MAKDMTLSDISTAMRDIDICMMTTFCKTHGLESRPMSDNQEVAYTGDSFFFAYDHSSVVKQIKADPRVNLGFTAKPLLGKNLYLSVTGKGETTQDRSEMEKHWVKDVEVWFKDGLDTPGITLIKVRADRIQYWHGIEEGEVTLGTPRAAA